MINKTRLYLLLLTFGLIAFCITFYITAFLLLIYAVMSFVAWSIIPVPLDIILSLFRVVIAVSLVTSTFFSFSKEGTDLVKRWSK